MSGEHALEGKRAFVTGAGVGIGKGVALELARQGAAVVLHYANSATGAEEAVEQIRGGGGRAWTVQGDLSDPQACRAVAAEASGFLGGLDILVNNAGITEPRPFLEVEPEQFDRTFNLNIRGQYFCAQAAARIMKDSGGGAIVNMSSVHAFGGVPENTVYAATKGAIIAFTRSLSMEMIRYRIRVNAVAPGHVEVPRHFSMPGYTRESGNASVPWGRVGEPADIGRVTAFLASEAAEFIVGQVIYVDGGLTARLALMPRK